jgi:hypothetical protein
MSQCGAQLCRIRRASRGQLRSRDTRASSVSAFANAIRKIRASFGSENEFQSQRVASGRQRTVALHVGFEASRAVVLLGGAEQIRGELLKLGIRVAKRIAQRYLRQSCQSAPPHEQNWHMFLRKHTVWACDFLQVYNVWFRPIFAFFIVDINTKQVVHVGVTLHPTVQWTAQQMREATPFGVGLQLTIRGNNVASTASLIGVLERRSRTGDSASAAASAARRAARCPCASRAAKV